MKHVILLPTYNESANIEAVVSKIFLLHPEIYVKVIDDNSPDGTGRIVSSMFSRYPHLSLLSRTGKEGLGKAYVAGFRDVLADPDATHLIMMDADMSHDPVYLTEMIEKSKTYDVVTGSRYIKGGKTVGWELWRRALSFFGNMYARTVTRVPLYDMTAGFNVISLSTLRKINLESFDSSGYAFIMELKYLLYKAGARMTEVPITFANRTGGESKISNHIVSEGILAPWRMIWRK